MEKVECKNELEELEAMIESFKKDKFSFKKVRSINDVEEYTKSYSELEDKEKDLLKGTFYHRVEKLLKEYNNGRTNK